MCIEVIFDVVSFSTLETSKSLFVVLVVFVTFEIVTSRSRIAALTAAETACLYMLV